MKNNRILMVGAGLALALVMLGACGGRTGEKEYGKAMKAWEQGNLVQARTLFEKATGRLSGNAKKSLAFNNLGRVLWQLDEPKAAADAFGDACTLSDTITDARLNLAIAQFYSGDLDGAKVSINMYLGEHPENKTALAVQSLIAARKRDWAQSSRIMEAAVAKDPSDPAAQNALALAELNHGQSSAQVVSRLQKVVSAHPGYAPAYYNLGVINDLWLHDGDTARRYYQSYLQKAGDNGSHVDAAQQAIARLSGQAPEPSATAAQQYINGTQLLAKQKYSEAIAQFQKAVQADPNHKSAFYNMGMANFQLQRYGSAQQAFERALQIDPAYNDARYMLAYALSQQKKWDDAEQQARELAKVDSERGGMLLKYIATARK